MNKISNPYLPFILLVCAILCNIAAQAQTSSDAMMMNKKQWCNGIAYEHAQWKNYWEGTLKRDNLNMGNFTSQTVVLMTNYGITGKLNVMAGMPYVWNRVSAGTLHTMQGLQDVSVALKWKPYTATWKKNKLSLLAVGGVSTPASAYVVDFLPLAIGFGTTNVTGRVMVDYQHGKFFTTASAAYTLRSATTIFRDAYYTDHVIYSHTVAMPDVAGYVVRAGLRSKYLIAEAVVSNLTTLGGFDIRRNDMPFPGNRMNMTSAGAHLKYTLPCYTHLELTADGSYTVKGRNVGQATVFCVGAYYLFTLGKNTSGNSR